MPTVTVKNIPTDLYDDLKQLAEANRRSINSEIIACIERAVHSTTLDPDTLLASARVLREKTRDYTTSDDRFSQAKSTGRL